MFRFARNVVNDAASFAVSLSGAAALQARGYDTRYAYALDRCHCDMDVLLQDLPSTLVWAWQGW